MSDNNTSSNKKSRKFLKWKAKKDKLRNMQNGLNNKDSTLNHNRPHNNGAIFTPQSSSKSSTVFPPHAHSATSAETHPSQCQVSTSSTTQQTCKSTTTAHSLPSSAASGQPRTCLNSQKNNPSAGSSGNSSGNSSGHNRSGQKPSSTFSVTQKTIAGPSKYLAIDCEMVGTGPKGHISQLARCSIVSYNGDVVFDKFIRPPDPVTDYRTRWSGIRRCDLIRATPFAEARKEILKLLMGKVLVGHAIHNDLKVLSYSHPKALIRDTSRIPLLNTKAGFPEKQIASLKRLTKAIFNRDIQTGRRGHSSVEDAKATMELYREVEVEWERTLASAPQS